jgi:hypothetical protein
LNIGSAQETKNSPEIPIINWTTQADYLRGRNNEQFSFLCPPNGTISGRLWGTDFYTDDSSICTAAVHAGLILPQKGGVVRIAIRPGASSYKATTRNNVTSKSYGEWPGSFIFVVETKGGQIPISWAVDINWNTQADHWRGQNNTRYKLRCPANGAISVRLWGTDLYTDDSSICTAAVHSGLITVENGGEAVIEIRPGASAYIGSNRYGVKSKDFSSWGGSFIFIR